MNRSEIFDWKFQRLVAYRKKGFVKLLPIPPCQELIDLRLLFSIFQQIKNSEIKPFRVGGGIGPCEYRGRRQGKPDLEIKRRRLANDTDINGAWADLSSDVCN